ncbi:MAG: FG-GAP-like repeat-containing protein, partial [Planctomycetota bacterium]
GLGLLAIVGGLVWFNSSLERMVSHDDDYLKEKTTPESIIAFCGDCHPMPDASIFPKSAWKMEVERGYQFFEKSGLSLSPPPLMDVVKFFEDAAPESLPVRERRPEKLQGWERLESPPWSTDKKSPPFAISNLKWAPLNKGEDPVLIACDMKKGVIAAWNPKKANEGWRTLVTAENPAHVEVVDLDADGFSDLLVADLGSFLPTDAKKGKALWYRGSQTGFLPPITILDDVGRVTDIQVLQDRSKGPLELVVAVFGWNTTGEVYFVRENPQASKEPPKNGMFEKKVIDNRHGAIHVPVADWNNDGKNDFVALFGQEHEAVTLYLNRGNGDFEIRNIYQGNHPGLGSSGIQQVDLDGDGDLDLLVSNGDVLDLPYLLKPYHAVFWLENKGSLNFEPHSVGPMYGVHRALAMSGPWKKTSNLAEIVSVAFLPREGFPQRETMDLESIIVWKPDAQGNYSPRVLESKTADYVTGEVGDFFGTGDTCVAVGNFSGKGPPVVVYRPTTKAAKDP